MLDEVFRPLHQFDFDVKNNRVKPVSFVTGYEVGEGNPGLSQRECKSARIRLPKRSRLASIRGKRRNIKHRRRQG